MCRPAQEDRILQERGAPRASAPRRSIWWNRRATLLVWQGAGLALGALIVAGLKLGLPQNDSNAIFITTLAWGWLAAALAALLLDTLVARQPYLHITAGLTSTALAFGGLFIWYLATRTAYSRWAVVVALIFALAMQALAWRRWRRGMTLRLGVVDQAMLDRLAPASRFPSDAAAIDHCEWVFVSGSETAPNVDGLVLADNSTASLRQGTALRAKLAGTQVYSESFVRSLLTGRLDIERADDVFLDDVPSSIAYVPVKRLLDLLGTVALAIFAVPLVLVAIACIRFESGGAALLVQPRVGLRGRVFGMLKLRTMVAEGHPSKGARVGTDPRVTRVGAWLRRTRVDELPQLWNVLRGDMSLIGPRPEWTQTAPALEQRIPQFAFRYLVRPGITGWAQIHQGHVTGEHDVRAKLEFDLYYAKNMSLALDLAIVMLTIRTVFTGRGAR